MADVFAKWRSGLAKTSKTAFGRLATLLGVTEITQETWDDLEALLIQADLGIETTAEILESLRRVVQSRGLTRSEELSEALQAELRARLQPPPALHWKDKPSVIMVAGVNGSGKTTTIGKLAAVFAEDGKKVVLAAADTFRAAAIEQLQKWGERTGATVVAREQGADPAGVAFEAIERARAENADILLIDTAGRLQNKTALMDELEKILRVIKKLDATAPHAALLVLDATVGQNALSQVEAFTRIAGITGLVMTKLDGTAKGGILVAVAAKFALPVHFIGVGESVDDLSTFDPGEFARALVGLGNGT